jgi:hypothetical protein
MGVGVVWRVTWLLLTMEIRGDVAETVFYACLEYRWGTQVIIIRRNTLALLRPTDGAYRVDGSKWALGGS